MKEQGRLGVKSSNYTQKSCTSQLCPVVHHVLTNQTVSKVSLPTARNTPDCSVWPSMCTAAATAMASAAKHHCHTAICQLGASLQRQRLSHHKVYRRARQLGRCLQVCSSFTPAETACGEQTSEHRLQRTTGQMVPTPGMTAARWQRAPVPLVINQPSTSFCQCLRRHPLACGAP